MGGRGNGADGEKLDGLSGVIRGYRDSKYSICDGEFFSRRVKEDVGGYGDHKEGDRWAR